MDYYRIRAGLLLSIAILATIVLAVLSMVATSHRIDAQVTAQFTEFLLG